MMNKEEYQKIIEKQKQEIEFLKKTIEKLEKELRIYKNPHIPSSKQIIKEKEEPKEPKKRGAPIGHNGATRKKPEPNRTIKHKKPESCPRCNGSKIRLKLFTKVIEDIVILKDVAEHQCYEGCCEECGAKFETTHPELSQKGEFGPNICSLWTMMHYYGTIPFDRLSTISKECFNTEITPSGLQNVIYRTAKVFEPNFEEIKEGMKNSRYVGSDETSYSYNGKKYWLWNISSEKDSLIVIRPGRGRVVLEEVLGKNFNGILNSDCFSSYENFNAKDHQKCWAHILEDAEDLAKHNHEGKKLHKELSQMYKYIKKAKENKLENSRKVKLWIWRQKQRIKSRMNKSYESKAVLNLFLRINKYLDYWFTCLKYDFVEPTNNERERNIRKGVIARKISGCHRSELGMHCREIMMTNLLTAQKRNENPFELVLNGLRSYNSGLKGAI